MHSLATAAVSRQPEGSDPRGSGALRAPSVAELLGRGRGGVIEGGKRPERPSGNRRRWGGVGPRGARQQAGMWSLAWGRAGGWALCVRLVCALGVCPLACRLSQQALGAGVALGRGVGRAGRCGPAGTAAAGGRSAARVTSAAGRSGS